MIHTLRGHRGAVEAVAFSPDGALLLSGGFDSTLRLWDAATGQHLRTFDEHSAQGQLCRVFSRWRSIALWKLGQNGSHLEPIDGSGPGNLVQFVGQRVADDDASGLLRCFQQRSPNLLSIVRGLETTSVAQVADHLYRPDMVEQLLKGDPLLKYEEAANELHLYKILGSGSPPQIEPLPARPDDRTEDTVRLRARIVDTGGGIGDKVVWRVNGVTQGSLAAPAASRSVAGYRTAEETFKIDPSKRNIVDLVAYNKAGLLASQPHRPFEVDRYVTTERRPSMHILAIGVSSYADKDWRLQFAVSDAKTFVAAVQEAARADLSHGEQDQCSWTPQLRSRASTRPSGA